MLVRRGWTDSPAAPPLDGDFLDPRRGLSALNEVRSLIPPSEKPAHGMRHSRSSSSNTGFVHIRRRYRQADIPSPDSSIPGPSALLLGLGILLLLFSSGCATSNSVTDPVSDAFPRPGARVVVGSVTNQSGASFELGVETLLYEALARQLEKEGLLKTNPASATDFLLETSITEFRPGSAFKRWVAPGWGCTVLVVDGVVREGGTREVVANLHDQRSIAAGGLYTLGAEYRVCDSIADDIAGDLARRIEKGGQFVLSPGLVADRLVGTGPQPGAATVRLLPVIDQRAERGRVGERRAAFGVSMGDIHLSRNAAEFVREALEAGFVAAGHELKPDHADTTLECALTKFWVHTKTTPLYWDVIAEVALTLTRLDEAEGPSQTFCATARKRTYVWPSVSLCEDVVDQCIGDVVLQVQRASIWGDSDRGDRGQSEN